MPKRRQIITPGGTSVKNVAAPVIVTTSGTQKVHEDAVTQSPASVSEEVITGDVDPDATNGGALQAPTLPVKVTSGKLGPSAAYSNKNWGFDGSRAYHPGSLFNINVSYATILLYDDYHVVGDQALVMIVYDNTDYNASPSYVQDTGITSVVWSIYKKFTDYAAYVAVVQAEDLSAGAIVYQITLGPSANHNFTYFAADNFSEFY